MTTEQKLQLAEQKITELEELLHEAYRKLNNSRKLSETDVDLMRSLYEKGVSQSELADVFDVNSGTVSRTIRKIYHKE